MRERGFTLVEVSVVLVIVGLLAGIAFPNLQGVLVNYRLDATAREIAASLREAQMRAINGEQQQITVRFDTRENTYELEWANPPRKEVRALPPGITLQKALFGTQHWVAFRDNGAPTPGGGSVTLAASTGREYEVSVLAATGRVVVRQTR